MGLRDTQSGSPRPLQPIPNSTTTSFPSHISNTSARTARPKIKKTTTTTQTRTKTKTTTTVTTTRTQTSCDPLTDDDYLNINTHDSDGTRDNDSDDKLSNPSMRKAFSHAPLVLSPKLQSRSPDGGIREPKDEVLTEDEKDDQTIHEASIHDSVMDVCDDPCLEVVLPAAVSPRQTIRDQMFSLFLDEMLVKSSVSRATSKRGMSYVAELLTLDLASPLLDSAIEAHCLAWLGTSRKDRDATQRAEAAFGRVLYLIRHSLDPHVIASPRRAATLDRAVITSIMLAGLHMCARSNWHTHYLGVHHYLIARGPTALDFENPFDRLLFGELRLSLLLIGLASRKALVFDRPEWRTKISARQWDSSAWYDMVIPLPTLLNRVDDLLKKPTDSPRLPERLADMCSQLESLRNNVTHWLHATSPYKGTAPRIMDINEEEDDNYVADIEEHCLISSSTAFDTYYRFPIVQLVFFPMNAWLMSLIIECTILRILQSPCFESDFVEWPINRDTEDVHRDAAVLARNICRCVHAFSQLPSMVDASFLSVCIELVRTFWEESDDALRMGWCQACAIATDIRISRMKIASQQGALNVDYLKQGIGGAARWKSSGSISKVS